MHRSTRIRIAAAIVAVSSMSLVAATSAAPFDPLDHVPAGAIAVATVEDPAALAVNAIGFLRSAGLDEPAAKAEGFIRDLMTTAQDGQSGEAARVVFRAIDTGKRFVAAIYPGTGESEALAALLFIPLRSSLSAEAAGEFEDAVRELVAAGSAATSFSMEYPGYVVVRSDGGAIPAYGEGATMKFGSLSRYPASSLAVWADPGAGARYLAMLPGKAGSMFGGGPDYADEYDYWSEPPQTGSSESGAVDNTAPVDDAASADEFAPIDNTAPVDNTATVDDAGMDVAVDNASAGADGGSAEPDYAEDFSWDAPVDDGESLVVDQFSDQIAALGEALQTGLEELAGVEFAIIVQKDRAWARAGVEVRSGGALAGIAGRASAGDKSLPYLAYCESDALVSVAWSAPSDWTLPVFEALYALVLPDGELAASSMASMRASAAATGMNGGASIRLEPSEELLEAIRGGSSPGNDEAMKLLERGLGLSLSGAVQVTDRQAFRDAAATSLDAVDDPAYADMLASSGVSFDIDRAVGVIDGMPYDDYSYSFTLGSAPDGEEAAIARLLGALVSPVYLYKDDKAFIGLDSPKAVAAGISKDGAKKPLRTDKAFKALRAGASADTRAIFYLSTRTLARLVMRALPADEAPLDFNAGALSGLLSWFDASPTALGFGLGLGSEDLRALVTLLSK